MPKDLKHFTPQPKSYKSPPYTVEMPGATKVKGETIPRRNVKTKDGLKLRPREDIATIYDILKYSSATYGNAKAVGSRNLVTTHDEIKKVKKMVDGQEVEQDKKWTYFELGPYNYMSFVEYEALALKVGAGFRNLGMEKGDRVHIFAGTRRVPERLIDMAVLTGL